MIRGPSTVLDPWIPIYGKITWDFKKNYWISEKLNCFQWIHHFNTLDLVNQHYFELCCSIKFIWSRWSALSMAGKASFKGFKDYGWSPCSTCVPDHQHFLTTVREICLELDILFIFHTCHVLATPWSFGRSMLVWPILGADVYFYWHSLGFWEAQHQSNRGPISQNNWYKRKNKLFYRLSHVDDGSWC